ncbi:MAG: hypothetical protein JW819_11955 [Candidatus Krumholzibacteriota bacterium]|nr:hypothetical protein [Candidatus Krumholzibacteriota bacterium]
MTAPDATAALLAPVLVLLAGAGLAALLGIRRRTAIPGASAAVVVWAALAGALVLVLAQPAGPPRAGLGGLLVGDPLGRMLQVLILFVAAGARLVFRLGPRGDAAGADAPREAAGAAPAVLILVATASLLLAAAAAQGWILLLALQLAAHTLIGAGPPARCHGAWRRHLPTLATGAVMAAGLALHALGGGTVYLGAVARPEAVAHPAAALTRAGFWLVVAALAAETGMVPFQLAGAVRTERAAPAAAALLAGGLTAAALGALTRLLLAGCAPEPAHWRPALAALAAAGALAGGLLLLAQTRLRRLLALSVAFHAALLLAAPLAGGPEALRALLFALAVSALAHLGAWAALSGLAGAADPMLFDLAGLGRRYPLPSAGLVLCLLALAGLPPTAGFQARALLAAAASRAGMEWIAALVLAATLLAAFAYLRVAAEVLFRGAWETPPTLTRPAGAAALLLALGGLLLALGLAPGPLLAAAGAAAWLF